MGNERVECLGGQGRKREWARLASPIPTTTYDSNCRLVVSS